MLKQNETKSNLLEYCLENEFCTSENNIEKGINRINIYPNRFESILILHELLNELSNKYDFIEVTKTWIIASER